MCRVAGSDRLREDDALPVLRFILCRCLTVASQVRYTECARFGCQVSRYRRYLARISRVIGIQRSGYPTCRQQFTTRPTAMFGSFISNAQNNARNAAGIRSTWRELAAKLKLNPGRPFLTSRLASGEILFKI